MAPGRLGIAVLGISTLGAAACAGILGIEDRQLDTQDGGGSSSGGGSGGGSGSGSGSGGGSGSGSGSGGGSGSGSSSGSGSGGGSGSSSGGGAMDGSSGSDAHAGDGGLVDSGPTCGDPCTMAMGLNHPFKMTADENNVYWTEFGSDTSSTNGSVKACPVSGCGAGPHTYAQLQANPRGIAVDNQNVYWGALGGIWSCPIAGCVGGTPAQIAGASAPFEVAVDATYVYWTDNFDDTVNRVPKNGGTDDMISDAAATGGLNQGQSCSVDSMFAYVSDYNYDVFRIPLGGGALQPMYEPNAGLLGPAELTIDATYLYLGGQGAILQMPKTAMLGATPTELVKNVPDPDGLHIDSNGVLYWSDWGSGSGPDGTVGKVPLDGGAFTLLQQNLMTPEGIAVTSTYVFWMSNGTLDPSSGNVAASSGTLYRMSK